ncbi:MAG: hypothetical protein AAFX85_08255 [Pseudomonadota bacterium]
MERNVVALIIAMALVWMASLAAHAEEAQADEAQASVVPVEDPVRILLAQTKPWGGGGGPRGRDCNRVCETEQVNCQRSCFAKPDAQEQESCSLGCVLIYVECVEGC